MHVFVTGASGWIGSALVPELLEAGHRVSGLARSDASAAALTTAGADVVRGSLDDLDVLRDAAAASDGVIHLAFKHDIAFTGGFAEATAADRGVITALGDTLAGSDRPLVIASGLLGLTPGRTATEQDGLEPGPADQDALPGDRHANGRFTIGLAERGIRSSVVRLAPTVHGPGDPGFMKIIIGTAREKGFSGYVGDGSSRWPAAHVLDAAHLFRLAVEKAPAGSMLHAAAEEGVRTRDIAEVIGRHLDVPAASVPPEELGWLGGPLGLDSAASSTATRALLGWSPTHPALLEDLEKGHYFQA